MHGRRPLERRLQVGGRHRRDLAGVEPAEPAAQPVGPMNAHSIGTCWSSIMPSRRASGSSSSSWSASGSPVTGRVAAMAGTTVRPAGPAPGPASRIDGAAGAGRRSYDGWRTLHTSGRATGRAVRRGCGALGPDAAAAAAAAGAVQEHALIGAGIGRGGRGPRRPPGGHRLRRRRPEGPLALRFAPPGRAVGLATRAVWSVAPKERGGWSRRTAPGRGLDPAPTGAGRHRRQPGRRCRARGAGPRRGPGRGPPRRRGRRARRPVGPARRAEAPGDLGRPGAGDRRGRRLDQHGGRRR